MKARTSVLAGAGALALIGCFTVHFDFDTEVDGTVEMKLGTIDGDCIDDDPDDAVVQTREGDRCRIEVTWSGTMIDMQAVRAEIEPDLPDGKSLADVDLDFASAVVTFHEIALTDASGAQVLPQPTVASWHGELSLAGSPLVDFAGNDTADLLGAVIAVDVGAAEIDVIEQAFAAAAPVPGAGGAGFLISMDSLQALDGRGDLFVSFSFAISFAGEGATEAL